MARLKPEGTQRQAIVIEGRAYDRLLLGVTRTEWETTAHQRVVAVD